MKKLKITTTMCITALMLITSSISFAGGNSGEQTIKSVSVAANGRVNIYGNTGSWNNPDSCDSAQYISLYPEVGGTVNEYYSEMYALLVASFLQGKVFTGYLDGCASVGGTTFAIISRVNAF